MTKVHNIVPTSRLNGGTPRDEYAQQRESWPRVKDLRRLGCKAYAFVEDSNRKKLDPKAAEGYLIGYSDVSKGYRIWVPDKRKIIEKSSVIFDELEVYQKAKEMVDGEENKEEVKKFLKRRGLVLTKNERYKVV
jgi:hypothetical protein